MMADFRDKLGNTGKNYDGVERRSGAREEALSRSEALMWCVETLSSWPTVSSEGVYNGPAPCGWAWWGGASAGLYLHRLGKMNIVKKSYNFIMAELAIKDAALTQEKFTGVTPESCKADMVNNPPHYQIMPGIGVIDVRKALMGKIPSRVPFSQTDDWSRSWEYITRMWGKNGLEDAKKARFYLNRLIDGMESDL